MKISHFSVRHPVIIGIILIALILFGVYCMFLQNVEFIGDLSLPQVYVVSIYPGASADDIEKDVINVLEENFVTLPDFKSMTSTSLNSAGVVIITFRDGVKPEDRINDVRNRITELESSLPSGLSGKPTCMIGGSELLPVLTFVAKGGDDKNALSKYLEDTLQPRISQIDGVSTISIDGKSSVRVNIRLLLDSLDSKGISPLTVYQILSYSNISMPLGSSYYEGKMVSARYDGSYSSLDEIKSLPVGANENGDIIRLSDVAEVTIDNSESDYYITQNGEDVVLVSICKRSSGNAVKITNSVSKILKEEEENSNGALHFEIVSEDKTTISNSLSTVVTSGILGVIIAILVIFLFLNDGKATLVIGLSIPLSIFFTFIVMKLMGISINILSISGIVVALGSIVDASIVMIDEIYRSYQALDENGRALYSVTESIDRGSDRIGMSVVGSNLTTVVVFIPLALLSGIVGMVLHDVSITFMVSILSSLVVAIIFVPWMMKKFLKEDNSKRRKKKDSFIVKGINKLEKVYKKAIGGVLKDPLIIILIALGMLLITVYAIPHLDMAFIPTTDNSDFYINITFPYGYEKEDTKRGMEEVEKVMLSYLPEDSIRTYVTFSGKGAGSSVSFTSSENEGGIHCVLKPVSKRNFSVHDAITDLQYLISSKIPDAKVSVTNGGFDRLVGFISGAGFGIELVGDNDDELYAEAERIRDYLLTDEEVMSAEINANYDSINAVMNTSYDNLSSLGLTSYQAAMTTAILYNGMDVGKFSAGDDNYDIHLSSDAPSYPLDDTLLTLIKVSGNSGNVPLSSISDLKLEKKLSEIHHTNRSKSMTVSASITSESTTEIQKRLNEYLKENPLKSGIEQNSSGLGKLISDALPPVIQAVVIAIFLVYFVMVLVFERFNQPLQIMATVPFCLVGAIIALIAFNSTLNLVSILGVVSLAGMLVNNGIILVDSVNDLNRESKRKMFKERGIDISSLTDKETYGKLNLKEEEEMLFENVKIGASSRIRPILMSSLSTILGVIPMAFAMGEGSEVYAPLGQVIMGGLTTSMLITLFITPTLCYYLERHKIRKSYKKKGSSIKGESYEI